MLATQPEIEIKRNEQIRKNCSASNWSYPRQPVLGTSIELEAPAEFMAVALNLRLAQLNGDKEYKGKLQIKNILTFSPFLGENPVLLTTESLKVIWNILD